MEVSYETAILYNLLGSVPNSFSSALPENSSTSFCTPEKNSILLISDFLKYYNIVLQYNDK